MGRLINLVSLESEPKSCASSNNNTNHHSAFCFPVSFEVCAPPAPAAAGTAGLCGPGPSPGGLQADGDLSPPILWLVAQGF